MISKTPLTVLKSELEILTAKNPQFVEQNKPSFKRIENAVLKISTQIKDVMDFVRTKPLQLEPHSSKTILESAVSSAVIPATVHVTLADNDVPLMCDIAQIETVIVNLLNNAVEAMNKSGKIWIDVVEENSNGIIRIANSGPSIPDENLGKVFEPLFTTKNSGAGLGLTTCKYVVERHGGKISVKNNPTTFTIVLPKTSQKL